MYRKRDTFCFLAQLLEILTSLNENLLMKIEDVQCFVFREPLMQQMPLPGAFAGPHSSCVAFGENVEAYSQPYHHGRTSR